MALYKLQNEYFNELCKDVEFERNESRSYYVATKLDYKGKKIAVAIPLRANINSKFQSKKDEYIATSPTEHTRNDCIAGWHITKIIPIDFSQLIKIKQLNASLMIAEYTITVNKEVFYSKVKAMLKCFEDGKEVFGAIDFDRALNILNTLINKQTL